MIVCINPSVTACHLPYMASPHPAMLRGTAEEECKVTLYSFAMSRGRGYFTPLLYMANTVLRNATGHGRGKRDISGIKRLIRWRFQPLRHFVTPPLLLTPHPVMLRGTAMEKFKILVLFNPLPPTVPRNMAGHFE